MLSLPTGTVTFLFTDIEGSTALLQRLGDRLYAEVQEERLRLLGLRSRMVPLGGDAMMPITRRLTFGR